MSLSNADYPHYRDLLRTEHMPLAFIDLDVFERNLNKVATWAAAAGKTVRVATSELRIVDLYRRIFASGDENLRGLLTFSVEESAWLAGLGYDDLLIACPTNQADDLRLLAEMSAAGKRVLLVVDNLEHLRQMDETGQRAGTVLRACLELDLAYRPFGFGPRFGLRRSPVASPLEALDLAQAASGLENVRIEGLLGYEAQLAGMQDARPRMPLTNPWVRFVKSILQRQIAGRRARVLQTLRGEGLELPLVNGGASGCLPDSLGDPSLSEVTLSLGLLGSPLLAYRSGVAYEPAAFIAVQLVRQPAPGWITCQGGGYPAVGGSGKTYLPMPLLPEGLKYPAGAGAGRVQTTFLLPDNYPDLRLGDPVILQPTRAGELAEHFNEIVLMRGGKIVDRVKTYHGDGKAFG